MVYRFATMFTGLVESVGTVREARGSGPRRLRIESTIPLREVCLGDSIAIDGCCLTVVDTSRGTLDFDAAHETLQRTTLGDLRIQDQVNLERAVRIGQHLGGHLVMGHVDGVGSITRLDERGGTLYVTIAAPPEMARYLAPRGSVTVAGISLTITANTGREFSVALIPHTRSVTTLSRLKLGGRVNLEADVIARYLERLLADSNPHQEPRLTVDFLKDRGFV